MMKRVSIWGTCVSVLLLFAIQTASAGSIQCGQSYIQDGERRPPGKYEVLKKCGEPTYRQGNVWIYESGGTTKTITFDDSGHVNSIE